MTIKSYVAMAALLALGASTPSAVYAMPPEPSGPHSEAEETTAPPHHDLIQGAHVEGHIAFMKAELGITPAQENLWAPVAAAMREDVKNLNDAEQNAASHMHGPEDAIQYLHNRVTFARLRADGEARFVHAFQPLYDALTPQQKHIADDLLIPDER